MSLRRVFPTYITDTLSVSEIKLGATSGRAFIDIGSLFTSYIDSEIHVVGTSGDILRGWIKSAGSGETLADSGGPLDDGELLNDPVFEDVTKWTIPYTGDWDIHSTNPGKATAAEAVDHNHSLVYQSVTAVEEGMCVKLVTSCDALSEGDYAAYINGKYLEYAGVNTIGDVSWYGIGGGNKYCGIDANNELTATFTGISLKNVLTPATTGVNIVSTKSGETYDWSNLSDDFKYYSGYFTYFLPSSYRVCRHKFMGR